MFDILVFNQSSDIDLLEQLCLHSCVLQVFNSFVLMSMSFLDLCESYTVERTSAFWIRKCRDFIFPEPKKKLLRDVIQSTITSTRPSEDPYEDPPDLKKIEINRHKASKAREQGDVKVAFKNSVFMQLFNCLQDLPVEQLRRSYVHKLDDGQERTFKVKFTGEGVQDNGGPYRECFNEVVSELFSQEVAFPLFIPCPNNRENQGQSQDCFVPNPACNDFQYYEFFGKIIGMALRHRIQLNMNLAPIFWKWIVEVPLTLDDLQEYDFHAAKVIQEVSKYVYLADSSLSSSADEDFFESVFDLTFECTLADGITKKELIPGGSRIKLSTEKKDHWVRLTEQCRLTEFKDQIDSIARGLNSVVPLAPFRIFSAHELELAVCGTPDFTVELLKSVTIYEGKVSEEDPHIQFFWNVLQEFTPEQKSSFVRFVWARSRLPKHAHEFPSKFKLQDPLTQTLENPDVHFPQSHTCFFTLSLPAYSSQSILREKLLYACENCSTMDLDLKLQDEELYNYNSHDL